jgi:hypothetical protein
MAEPKPRTRRSEDRAERTAPRRHRAGDDARTESEPAPRRRKTTEAVHRRRADQLDASDKRTATRSTTRESDGSRLEKGERSGTSVSERDDRSTRPRPTRHRSASGMDAQHAAAAAAGYVQQLTGTQPEGLTSLEHTDDGWRIGVEVLESRRIPDSTDILAEYQVDLDRDGDLVAYRRERRYHRGRVEGDQQ